MWSAVRERASAVQILPVISRDRGRRMDGEDGGEEGAVLSQFGETGLRVDTKRKRIQRNVTGHSNGANQTTDEGKEEEGRWVN